MLLRIVFVIAATMLSASVAAGLPLPPGYVYHHVAAGEILAEIAERYGASVEVLRVVNPGYAAGFPPGAVLRVPRVAGQIVTLADRSGFLDLAFAHGLSPSALLAANGLNGIGALHPGQRLFVPTLEQQAAVPPPAAPGGPVGVEEGRAALVAAAVAQLSKAAVLLPAYEPAPAGYAWPLPVHGRLSSLFGRRNISVGGNTFHGGIDLAVPVGTEVLAAKGGTVAKAGWGGAYGYVVYLDHADGSQTRYGHLSGILVTPGQAVVRGQTLGRSGSTGASTGPHLHFEIRLNGRVVDPLSYLSWRPLAGR